MDNVHKLSLIKSEKEEKSVQEWHEECRKAIERIYEQITTGGAEFMLVISKMLDDPIPYLDMFSDEQPSLTTLVGNLEVTKQNLMMISMVSSEYDE